MEQGTLSPSTVGDNTNITITLINNTLQWITVLAEPSNLCHRTTKIIRIGVQTTNPRNSNWKNPYKQKVLQIGTKMLIARYLQGKHVQYHQLVMHAPYPPLSSSMANTSNISIGKIAIPFVVYPTCKESKEKRGGTRQGKRGGKRCKKRQTLETTYFTIKIYNLSSSVFSDTELDLLRKGLNFDPPSTPLSIWVIYRSK